MKHLFFPPPPPPTAFHFWKARVITQTVAAQLCVSRVCSAMVPSSPHTPLRVRASMQFRANPATSINIYLQFTNN